MSIASCTAHITGEQQEILRYIHARHNTMRLLIRRSGLVERRVQRRVQRRINELLNLGWVEHVHTRTQSGGRIRVFGLTEEGKRNVPSGL